jgi:hypothetical protein
MLHHPVMKLRRDFFGLFFREVAQPGLEHLAWDQGAGGSNPLFPILGV